LQLVKDLNFINSIIGRYVAGFLQETTLAVQIFPKFTSKNTIFKNMKIRKMFFFGKIHAILAGKKNKSCRFLKNPQFCFHFQLFFFKNG